MEALQSGLVYGFASQVDGMVERISKELGADPIVIVGLARTPLGRFGTADEVANAAFFAGLTLALAAEHGDIARRKGFAHVASGPLVRSSYHAADFHPVIRK